MKVVRFLLTILPVVVGQTCPTRPVTDPYQDMYKDMLFPDRLVLCCENRISATLPPQGPPLVGASCRNPLKTCFFGSQTCPDGSIHPTTRSDCDGSQWVNSPIECPTCPDMDLCCGSAKLGSICGRVMEDTGPGLPPFDGIGDASIPSVAIRLLDEASGIVVGTTTSDSDGCFAFEDIPRGPYLVVRTNFPIFVAATGPEIALADSFHNTAREVCFLDYVP